MDGGHPRGRYNKASDAARARVIQEAEAGGDWKMVARANGIPYKTAHDWLRKGNPERNKRGGGRAKKISAEIMEVIVNWVEENCQITVKEICRRLRNERNIIVSHQSVSKRLDGQLVTVKKVHNLAHGVNTPENKELRRQYVDNILHHVALQKYIVFVDETNFNLFCRRTTGRAVRGQRASVKLPNSKGPNLHVIGCISSTGMQYWERKRGAFRKEHFQEWMKRCLRVCIQNGHAPNSIVIVMDNAPAHSRLEGALVDS